jgi:hypothetical protein
VLLKSFHTSLVSAAGCSRLIFALYEAGKIPYITFRSHASLVVAVRLVLHQTILGLFFYFLKFSCGKNET